MGKDGLGELELGVSLPPGRFISDKIPVALTVLTCFFWKQTLLRAEFPRLFQNISLIPNTCPKMRGVFSGIYCENLVKHLKVKFIHTESLNWVLLELLTDLSTLSLRQFLLPYLALVLWCFFCLVLWFSVSTSVSSVLGAWMVFCPVISLLLQVQKELLMLQGFSFSLLVRTEQWLPSNAQSTGNRKCPFLPTLDLTLTWAQPLSVFLQQWCNLCVL